MIATLEKIACEEGLPFRYGKWKEGNVLADDEPDGRWLFQNGYVNGTFGLSSDNSIDITYNVNLWLWADSQLSDLPEKRGPELLDLNLQAIRLYKRLSMYGEVSRATFVEGINLFDRNLDGINLVFTFTPFDLFTLC